MFNVSDHILSKYVNRVNICTLFDVDLSMVGGKE